MRARSTPWTSCGFSFTWCSSLRSASASSASCSAAGSSSAFGGIGLTVAALLLGGSQIEVTGPIESTRYVGLDWFCLNLFVLALLFVPLELAFARLPAQGVFRRGWLTDLLHFAVSHMAVQLTVLLTLVPAALFFRWAVHPGVLAASRIHLADAVVTRALAFVPLYVLGFAEPAVYAYLVFVSFHAIFVHANVRFDFGRLERVIGTPRFHHWHHAADADAVDKNFAIHLPVIDRVFGTLHMPGDRWPTAYGIAGNPVPEAYWRQLTYPFTRLTG